MKTYNLKMSVKEKSFVRKDKLVRVRGKGGFVQAEPGDKIVWSRDNASDSRVYTVRFYGVDDEDQKDELWPFLWPVDPVTPARRVLRVDQAVTTTLASVATYKYAVDTDDNTVEPMDPMIIVRDVQRGRTIRTVLISAALGAGVGALMTALILTRH